MGLWQSTVVKRKHLCLRLWNTAAGLCQRLVHEVHHWVIICYVGVWRGQKLAS